VPNGEEIVMRTILVIVALALLLAGPVWAAEAVELRHKFVKSQKVLLRDRLETSVGFKVPQRGDTEALIKLDRTWEETTRSVREKKIITASMNAKITALHFQMTIPDKGSVNFDTESPQARQEAAMDPIAAGLYRLKGRKFKYSVDGLGRAVRVSGMNKTVRAFFGKVKAKEAITQGAAKICMALMGDDGFSDAIKEYYVAFPKDETLPRDRWKGKMENSIYPIGIVHSSVEYTLTKVEEGKAYITLSGKVDKVDTRTAGFELPAKDDPTFGMLTQILSTLTISESSVKGEIVLDLKEGRVTKATHTITMRCQCELDIFGNVTPIPFLVKKTRTVEVVQPKKEEK
jgi:hypothetical protein